MLVLDRPSIFVAALLMFSATLPAYEKPAENSVVEKTVPEKTVPENTVPENTVLAARDKSAAIQIFPSQIFISQDYPARFIAIQTASDGSTLDRTRDVAAALIAQQTEETKLSHQPPMLIIEANGLVRRNVNVTPSPSIELVAVVDGQPIKLLASASAAASASPSFPREISAILGKSGCNLGTCHGNLHGKAGFHLSLRGDDAKFDYGAIVRDASGRRINSFAAELSLLLTKPSGQLAHQGGVRFDVGSIPYELMKRWIDDGCRWNSEPGSTDDSKTEPIINGSVPGTFDSPADTLVKLNVYPTEAMLAPENRAQQIVVTATFADGTTRDVTAWARYEPSLVTAVGITADGLVTADKPLDVSVSVSYLSGRAASRLTFLPDHQEKLQPASLQSENSQHIDQIVEQQLQRMRLYPRELASDNVLLRRLYLVVVGRLPTVSETKEYLASTELDKRERLTERLLNNSGYAALWAMRWSDLLRNEQKVMSPAGARGWHAWMTEQVSTDRPLNEFVAEMITTVGSTYKNPPASFHRTHRDPETAAESIGQVFLGVRLQCARCHNHPFDKWRQDDYYGLAAYFTTLERKQVDNEPKDKFDKHIISGDEVISLTEKSAAIAHPGRAANVPPKPLTDTYENDAQGNAITGNSPLVTATEETPLDSLAGWLTNDNRLFARNMANRVWYHLLGRGIVDPPDDFRDSNPASNPALLEYLTDELIRSNYSVRYLSKLILTSRTFARAAVDDVHSQGLDAEANFAGYPLRRLSAEVLIDALSDVTQVVSKIDDDASAPTSMQRAIVRAEVPPGSGFLATFGKPNRLLICECERSNAVSLGQSLMLVNGADMRSKLSESRNRIAGILDHKNDLALAISDLYLATLTRYPSDTESKRMNDYISQSTNQRGALEDVLWALINSQEFAVIR